MINTLASLELKSAPQTREKLGTGLSLTYFKPGLGRGGATFSDLMMLDIFSEVGVDVSISTGYVSPSVLPVVERVTDKINVLPILDRGYNETSGSSLINSMMLEFDKQAEKSNFLLFSQPFSGDAPYFGEAVSLLKQGFWHRSHDPIRIAKAFSQLHHESKLLPTTKILARQMAEINDKAEIIIIPPFIDTKRLDQSLHTAKEIRQELQIGPTDFVILQPTRIHANKRIDRSILLAELLQQKYGDKKKIHLIVSGSSDQSPESQAERRKLEEVAQRLHFPNLKFANGVTRIGDYMRASDLVTFMSDQEGWGMPPAEASYLGVPVLVTPYTDQYGEPIFKEVYEGFEFILEEPNSETITKQTVDAVSELINDPHSYDDQILNNQGKVQQYSREAMIDGVTKLLQNYQR